MTSARSTSTHSASRSPSTPSGCTPHFLANLTTSSAIDLTCRVEVPDTTTRKSAMLVLPRTSISTASLAFISASAAWTCFRRASGVGAGVGILVLMTWAWVAKRAPRIAAGQPHRGELYPRPVKPRDADVALHGGRQPGRRLAPRQRAADGRGRLGPRREVQAVERPGGPRPQRRGRLDPA